MAGISSSSRWVCPSDRELMFRSKMGDGRGWSTRSAVTDGKLPATLRDDEWACIKKAFLLAEKYDQIELRRVRGMVSKLDRLQRGSPMPPGCPYYCRLCGTEFNIITKGKLKLCQTCGRTVCRLCGFETTILGKRSWMCHYCSECQEVWKKSGAWFWGGLTPAMMVTNDEDSIQHLNKSRARSVDQRLDSRTLAPISESALDRLRSVAAQANADSSMDEGLGSRSVSPSAMEEARASAVRKTYGRGKRGLSPRLGGQQFDCAADSRERSKAFSENTKLAGRRITLSAVQGGWDTDSMDGRTPSPEPRISSLSSRQHSKSPASSPRRRRKRPNDYELFKRQTNPKRTSVAVNNSSSDDEVADGFAHLDTLVKEIKSVKKAERGNSSPLPGGALGEVLFDVSYDSYNSSLTVVIKRCRDLKGMNRDGLSDPYIVLQLLPCSSKATEKRTNIHRRTIDPEFNETFTYHGLSEAELSSYTLRLHVFDYQRVTADQFIGEVLVNLKDISTNQMMFFARELQPCKTNTLESHTKTNSRGKIMLSLHYITSIETLVVGIVRAAGLKPMDLDGLADPYVKCYLYPDPQKQTKNKTRVQPNCLNPEFNEQFRYRLPKHELASRSLEVSVWDHDWSSKNDFIGAVVLSKNATGTALKHFFDTITITDRTHHAWHSLSDQLSDTKTK